MIEFVHKIRVAYADTDQMGYVYYGNYARYFEVARTEALRDLGISYSEMEKSGIMMPVTNYSIRYNSPALYDDEISVKVSIAEVPGRFIVFGYYVENQQQQKLCEGETRLAFVHKSTGKITHAPDYLIQKIKEQLT